MGSSDKTANMKLSQFQDNDKPTWRGDYNSDMQKMDVAMTRQDEDIRGAQNLASSAMATATAASTGVTANAEAIGALGTEVDSVSSGLAAADARLTAAINKAIADLSIGNPGVKYKAVSGQLRNDGGVWNLITGAHTNMNVDSISVNGNFLEINFPGINAKKVVSFLIGPDERLALEGFTIGASVGVAKASVLFSKQGAYADYVSWDGTKWVSAGANFTFDTSKFATDGFLYCLHPRFPVASSTDLFDISVSGRAASLAVAEGGSSDRVVVRWLNFDGSVIKTPSSVCKAFVSHRMSGPADPVLIDNATYPNSNVWFYGVLEV